MCLHMYLVHQTGASLLQAAAGVPSDASGFAPLQCTACASAPVFTRADEAGSHVMREHFDSAWLLAGASSSAPSEVGGGATSTDSSSSSAPSASAPAATAASAAPSKSVTCLNCGVSVPSSKAAAHANNQCAALSSRAHVVTLPEASRGRCAGIGRVEDELTAATWALFDRNRLAGQAAGRHHNVLVAVRATLNTVKLRLPVPYGRGDKAHCLRFGCSDFVALNAWASISNFAVRALSTLSLSPFTTAVTYAIARNRSSIRILSPRRFSKRSTTACLIICIRAPRPALQR